MRKLWLVFAQAVTVTLAALFVVSLVKPDWLAWRAQVVEVREARARGAAPPAAAPRGRAGSPSATRRARRSPRWSTSRPRARCAARNPLLDDPAFQRFFGERFSLPPETQLSLGSGVIVSREGYILTNDHVVEGVTEIQVTLARRRAPSSARSWAPIPTPTSRCVRVDATGPHADHLRPVGPGAGGRRRARDRRPFSVGQTVTMGIVSARRAARSAPRTRSAASSRPTPRSTPATRAARWSTPTAT